MVGGPTFNIPMPADLMIEKEQQAEAENEAIRTQKYKVIRKCPKCGSIYSARVSTNNSDGVFSDSFIDIYCTGCNYIYDTEELEIE